ncbi:radical SAM protein [Desulfococcaceae bacterium HSG7]|nr:radical SAM protein [Desulfococcaceae bacterium HSG7]
MKAINQARVYSSKKTRLETVIPLETPYSVHIDVCSVCNFKCNFCFQADSDAIKKKGLSRGFMDLRLFKKVVDDLIHFNEKHKKVKIGLHGEPTLHPELPQMISYLKARNVTEVIELFTNGSKLNPKLNKEIIDAGLTRINISVEALSSEGYQTIAGAKVDMNKFINNIKDLYDRRNGCQIYIKTVDIDFNEQDKNTFYSMFGDSCDEIFIENVVPQWTDINKFEIKGTGMYGQKIEKYKYVCPFLFMYLHFNFDGTTSGCTLDWGKEVLIGDINKESALEIWNGDKLKKLQVVHLEKKRSKVPFCAECLAPMVCCLEDLDEYCDVLLEKINK